MSSRGRPKKYRLVKTEPRSTQFSPRGKPGRPDETVLSMDEFEAIRLADFLENEQKQAAQSMHISQQTFSRVLNRAHKKVAESLLQGKIIKIEGGVYVLTKKQGGQIIPLKQDPKSTSASPTEKRK